MTDERDLTDPALDAAWRAQSAEAPPPALDAAILAAAHRAVKSAPEKIGPGYEATRPWRWWAPLAAAAAIGAIAIGVLQLAPSETDPASAVVSDVPAGARPASPPPAVPAAPMESPAPPARVAKEATSPRAQAAAKPDATRGAPAQRQERVATLTPPPVAADRSEDKQTLERRAAPEPFPAQSEMAPSAPPPPAAAPAPSAEIAAGRVGSVERERAASAPAAAAMSKRTMRDDAAAPRTPDEWIAQIRRLLAEGNVTEAQQALVAFRAAHADADARLPSDLRPWAAGVPHR